MQKAMAGKDVTQEARELEATLPPGFLESMKQLQPEDAGSPGPSLSENEARRLVEEAAAEGRITSEAAAEVLNAPAGDEKRSIWKRLIGTGRKP